MLWKSVQCLCVAENAFWIWTQDVYFSNIIIKLCSPGSIFDPDHMLLSAVLCILPVSAWGSSRFPHGMGWDLIHLTYSVTVTLTRIKWLLKINK